MALKSKTDDGMTTS